MAVVRVTATLPADLLKSVDRQARRKGLSRSAVMTEGLRRYVASPEEPAVQTPAVVAAASDESLLAELGRRLGRQTGRAGEPVVAVNVDRARLGELARRYGIRTLALFGSVLRPDFTPRSDVDVLVEFEPGRTPGLGFVSLAEELSALFGGRRVDLVTLKSLHPLLRDEIERSAVVLHAS